MIAFCLAMTFWSAPCELPRPAEPEPQLFYYGSEARDDDVLRAMTLTISTPIAGPVIEWKPSIAVFKGPERREGRRHRRDIVVTTSIDRSLDGYQEVEAAARRHAVPVQLALAVAKQESGGHCRARSGKNARGVMQVIPSTAAIHGIRASQLYDCRAGAEAGVRELKRLLELTDGDIKKTLVGYNCGEGCIGRKRLPRETVGYIRNVTGKGATTWTRQQQTFHVKPRATLIAERQNSR